MEASWVSKIVSWKRRSEDVAIVGEHEWGVVVQSSNRCEERCVSDGVVGGLGTSMSIGVSEARILASHRREMRFLVQIAPFQYHSQCNEHLGR